MVGIFDSGLGGLTALKEAMALMPDCDFVYFGDTGRVPYGTRSPETIRKYAAEAMRFLSECGVDAVLAACGTVSSVALDSLTKDFDFPIIGVVNPAVRDALSATKNKRIAVAGTGATIRSGTFEKLLKSADAKIETIGIPCPLFVPLVENGFIESENEVTRLVAEKYLAPVREFGADTLILGCTHFPIISDIISSVLPGVTLINSGRSAAVELARTHPEAGGHGKVKYFVSDSPDGFGAVAAIFMGRPVTCFAEKINIENY